MSHSERIIESYFSVSEGQLVAGGRRISELAEEFGTPLYVYSPEVLRRKMKDMACALPGFDVYFSVKSNPTPAIVQVLLGEGCGLNVATTGELFLARECGCAPEKIILAGAGKTDRELEAGVRSCVEEIYAESLAEIEKLSCLANTHRREVRVGIRMNPGEISWQDKVVMDQKPAAYGFDEADLEEAVHKIRISENLEFCGINVYFGTQILSVDLLLGAYSYAFDIAAQVADAADRQLRTIDFSGGFGVPYYPNEKELPLEDFACQLQAIISQARQHSGLERTRLVVEPGRYLVSEAGLYVTRVIARKRSYGKEYLIVDGGIHHHLAATGNLGHVIKRNFPIAVANRICEEHVEYMDIVGRQCSSLDTLARNAKLPAVCPGDTVVFFQSGAYARSVSPLGFRSHPAPPEVMVENGRARLVRVGGDNSNVICGTCLDKNIWMQEQENV